MQDERIINPATRMDAVTLRVHDLELMSGYYSRAFGMEPIEEGTAGREVRRVLGRGGLPMVRLIHTPDLPPVDPRQPGLFHTAFLFPDERSLAQVVLRAAQQPDSRFVGTGDHLVSEAFYFTDPEGNGVELYRDRPRSQWTYVNGEVQMDTLWLDPNEYISTHLGASDTGALRRPDSQPADAARVGHVHLQVGAIEPARRFYVDGLGFEVTTTATPGALFTSAGGYHHHLAMNVWNSRGAGPRAASLGLGNVAISVPVREDLDALSARLGHLHIPYSSDGRSLTAKDPWGTDVTVSVAGSSAEEVIERPA